MLAIVAQDALALVPTYATVFAQNCTQNLLSSLLTVVDPKSNFHVLARLQVTIGQLLEEVENDISVVVFVRVGSFHQLLLHFLATLDELEELVELNVAVIVDLLYHFFDLFTRIDEAQGDQRIFKLVNTNSVTTIFVKIVEAVVEDLHLVLVEVDVLRLAVLAKPLALHTSRLMLSVKSNQTHIERLERIGNLQ